jgi:hypothetical protein
MKKFLILILLFACMISLVSGETFTGTLGSTDYISDNYNYDNGCGNIYGIQLEYISFAQIQNYAGIKSIIKFDTTSGRPTYLPGAPVSASAPVTFKVGGVTVGTGYIGYQRLFNTATPPVEQNGYEYVVFNDWSGSTLYSGGVNVLADGGQNISGSGITFPSTGCKNTSSPVGFPSNTQTNGYAQGDHPVLTVNVVDAVLNDWELTTGYGIASGSVFKGIYPSRAWLFNGNGVPLSSDNGTIITTFNFTASDPTGYKIGIQSPIYHKFYNSTIIPFSGPITTAPVIIPTAYPNVTTTTVPVGSGNETPGPVPLGFVRSWVMVRDGQLGTPALLRGMDITIKDNIAGTWHNSTGDLDGNFWIDTLPNDNINIYIEDPSGGYYSVSAQGQPTPTLADLLAGFGEKTFNMVMYPVVALPVQFVSFDVSAVDSQTHNYLSNVQLEVKYGGTIQGGVITGMAENFVVPNNTQMSIKATKSGYNTASVSVNSGPTLSNTTIIYMVSVGVQPTPTSSRTGVIPTRTVITGNVTPVPTATTPPVYTGFWAPLANWFSVMGADVSTIGLLLAGLFIFCGFCVGGWSNAAFGNLTFNGPGSLVGGIFGFLLSVAFGFIPLVYLFGVIFIGIFVAIMMR